MAMSSQSLKIVCVGKQKMMLKVSDAYYTLNFVYIKEIFSITGRISFLSKDERRAMKRKYIKTNKRVTIHR